MAKKKKDEETIQAPTLRHIRILRSIATAQGVYQPGKVLIVGQDINEKTARQWVMIGVATEDKMLGGAPEIK